MGCVLPCTVENVHHAAMQPHDVALCRRSRGRAKSTKTCRSIRAHMRHRVGAGAKRSKACWRLIASPSALWSAAPAHRLVGIVWHALAAVEVRAELEHRRHLSLMLHTTEQELHRTGESTRRTRTSPTAAAAGAAPSRAEPSAPVRTAPVLTAPPSAVDTRPSPSRRRVDRNRARALFRFRV